MVAFLAALAFAVAPNPPGTFIDATGDSGTAPDITKIVASGGATGHLTFVVSFATPYGANSNISIFLDTDRNKSTGDPNGADYLLGPGGLEVWDSAAQDFEPTGADATFSVAPGGRALEASALAVDVGNPSTVNVIVQSVDGAGGPGHQDFAVAIWSKSSASGLTVTDARQTAAKAGTVWAVTVRASGGTAGDQTAVLCSAASGKVRLLVPNHVAIVTPGGSITGLCAFKVPKSLKGKKLHATITISNGGNAVTRSFTAKAK
ncbi:MAG TPA: hypothetical protein VIE38_13145 [Gaiellaceae bacterium]|jgi:hypothetical protein